MYLIYESATSKRDKPELIKKVVYLAEKIQERWKITWNKISCVSRKGDLYVTRENTMPAVLAELAFVR